MMFVRLALEDEMENIVEMARENVEQTLPAELHLFDPDAVRNIFRQYLDESDPTFFVLEDNRKIVGFLQVYRCVYDYRPGLYTIQKVLYVKPEKRGSRGAVLLMKHLIEWSRYIGADRVEGGNDNSFNSERTAAFLGHFGFEKVGYSMRRELD